MTLDNNKNEKPGIYVIQDLTDGKAYIGSSVNLKRRMNEHKYRLTHDRHNNIRLQRAFNNGNALNIVAIPVISEEKNNIRQMEQELLDEFHPKGLLYNVAKNVEAPAVGIKPSAETIEKCRLVNLGRKHTPETIEKNRQARLGAKQSPETIAKRVEKLKGVPRPEYVRQLISQKRLGIEFSDKTKQKMSDSAKMRGYCDSQIKGMKKAISKPISVNGVVYESASAAARIFGIDPGTAMDRAKSSSIKFNNWKLE